MDVGSLVARYARRFCRLHADLHSVSSPLGVPVFAAWVGEPSEPGSIAAG
jgi:hypothetical protein